MSDGVPYITPLWFGTKTGFTGITTSNNALHLCFHTFADSGDTSGNRVRTLDQNEFEVQINNVPPAVTSA